MTNQKGFGSNCIDDHLDLKKIPYHIAIIMDGNRRWAKKNKLSDIEGHWAGAKALMDVAEAASNIGVKVLTVYAFSTENWSRSKTEINSLMILFETYLKKQRKTLKKNGISLQTIGDISACPVSVKKNLEKTKLITKDGNRMTLVIAFNYGGRDDIKRAIQKILNDYDQGNVSKEGISEELISKYMDTAPWKDPDLLIRTSGEHRLSNFLLWQSSYSEIYVTEVLWPEFSKEQLYASILDFQLRKRRLGI